MSVGHCSLISHNAARLLGATLGISGHWGAGITLQEEVWILSHLYGRRVGGKQVGVTDLSKNNCIIYKIPRSSETRGAG